MEKLTVAQLVKKFVAFYVTRRFTYMTTKSRYWTYPELLQLSQQ